MSKINGRQLCAMLLICDAFSMFCFTGGMSLVTAAGLAAGTFIQWAAVQPLLRRGGAVTKGEKLVFGAYFIYWGGVLFNLQWETSRDIYIPYESSGGIWGKLLISGLIALVCLYISSVGIKAVSRAALIAAAVGAGCLLIAGISAVRSPHWENLTLAESGRSFGEEVLRSAAMSGAVGGLAVLAPAAKGDSRRTAAVYFACKLVLVTGMVLTSVLVAGGIMSVTELPVVTAAQLSQPFPVQRIDSLFLMVFTVYAVFSIGIQAASAAYLIGEVWPSAEKYTGAAAVVLMIAAGALLSKVQLYSGSNAAVIFAAVTAVPMLGAAAESAKARRVRGC